MIFKKYVSIVSKIFAENKLLKLVVVVLAILVCYSQMSLVTMVREARTVIVPIGLDEQVEIGDDYVDENYLNAMATYVATLLYSTTPLKIETQYRLLSEIFDENLYKRYAENLFKTAASHKKNQVSQTMVLDKITIEYEPKKRVYVNVTVDKYIFGKKQDETSTIPHTLVIDYKIQNGNFIISDLGETTINGGALTNE